MHVHRNRPLLHATSLVRIWSRIKAINPDMIRFSNLPDCIFRRCTGSSFHRALNKRIIYGFSLLIFLFFCSCASTNRASYESQRRGLLMLEGEHIYKNKGFYKSKKSQKQRKKTMRAHKKHLRR